MLGGMVVVFSFVAGWALVRGVLERRRPASPTVSSASVPEWLERHQLLHMQSRLAAQQHHVKERRQDVERKRLVFVGVAAGLLAFAGVGRYPLAVFPYLYTGLLQHELRIAIRRE